MVRWITAFLDTPREAPRSAEAAVFWAQATGTRLSPRRGPYQQFATLLPSDGDAYLRIEDTNDGDPNCHLDLHVDDVSLAAAEAARVGATLVADLGTLMLARSPGGLAFCLVTHRGEHQRPAPTGAGERSSLVDQVCIDVPTTLFDAELTWWSALLGWPRRRGALPEFAYLERPADLPLRLLFQRLDAPATGTATAHLDVACTNRPAEVARHLRLGATFHCHEQHWDTLQDPVGRQYCLTDRDPRTGRLPPADRSSTASTVSQW